MFWAAREVCLADLGDTRRNHRLISILAALADHPASSVPEAMGDWSATKACYRFLDNDQVKPNAIYQAHREATLERAKECDVLLAVQDTTVFNFTLHRKTEGLGPIGQKGLSGFFYHGCLGVSSDGVPLGLLAHRMWVRPTEGRDSRNSHKYRPLQDKESARWIEVTREAAKDLPANTRVVMVGDRESDIFDLFTLAAQEQRDILVRAAWNRRLADSPEHLWEAVEGTPALGQITISLPRSKGQPDRIATLSLHSASVKLRPPPHRKKEKLPVVTLNAVLVREAETQQDAEPVEWLLLTTLAVDSLDAAQKCLTWYTYRWRIERYHYILKSGCLIEKLQLETADRLLRALAVYSIVAWRLLWLTYQARQTPKAPCTVALSEKEWQALYATIKRSTSMPVQPPELGTAVRWIAMLGGFLGRKRDGEPGVKVLWRGLRRLEDLTLMWELHHPP